MTSTDDVHRLHREGFSIRAIAARLGLSRMTVHRRLSADLSVDPDSQDFRGDQRGYRQASRARIP